MYYLLEDEGVRSRRSSQEFFLLLAMPLLGPHCKKLQCENQVFPLSWHKPPQLPMLQICESQWPFECRKKSDIEEATFGQPQLKELPTIQSAKRDTAAFLCGGK